MKKFKFIFSVVLFALIFLPCQLLFSQTCSNDPDDPGNCDTLFVERSNGQCLPNSEVILHVTAFHDELLTGVKIPLKYKNPQTDIFLDSAKLTVFPGITGDTVIDRSAGTIIYFCIGLTGGTIPPGTDTLFTLYFRTGTTSWDPSVHNPIDTFTIGGPGGAGLSFVDTAGHDIQPVFDSPEFCLGGIDSSQCTNDPDDPGNCDTLFVERSNGQCLPNSQITLHVSASHDEPLSGWAIPLIYKNPQTDISLDSIQLKSFTEMTVDTIIDRSAGTFVIYGLGLTGGTIPPALDTFGIVYFRTGPTWNPSVHNPIDTFTLPGGQGLSFVDTANNDIQPVFDSPEFCLGGIDSSQCSNDPDDPGNCDTLWIEQENGKILPNTSVVRHVVVYRDEVLTGWVIPIKYKNPQTDLFLDSVKLTSLNGGVLQEIVIDSSRGTIFLFGPGDFNSGQLPPGTDTFAILYFRTGPSWDPTVANPLDTYTIGGPGGQGLGFVDNASNFFIPVYYTPGDLDVVDDPRAQSARPKTFSLSQNYPNPFNTETVITFALPRSSDVKIEIFNILGQKVRDLVDEEVSAGYKKVVWDGKDNAGKAVASGVYLYQLKAEGFREAKRMILLK